ncbi:hypothetical protein FACS189476_10620 [Spirochaetia bacterium]|nr:hypothetical protein FACS189476_10620 [Spirochaetia bacterium]
MQIYFLKYIIIDMSRIINRKRFLGFLIGAFLLPQGAQAADSRGVPIEVNIIMDGSAVMQAAGDEAVNWVSSYVIDSLLQDGDTLRLWIAGETARTLFSGPIKDAAAKDEVRNLLRSAVPGSDTADFTTALQEAALQDASRSGSSITYTLLVTASSAGLSPTLLGAGANYMRYSRVMEFSGWRALVIALNTDSRVQNAAKAYMAGL